MATFGRYEILDRIASGGMAEVYRARAWGAGDFAKEVVIKKILPGYSADPEFRSLFIQEARISVGLTHSRIVQVLDFGIMEGSYFIALELVDGPNLGELLHALRKTKAPLPLAATVHVITEALSGLDYAHRRTDAAGRPLEIVHRDVSPSNVLLSFEGEVKIGDFGIARAAGSPSLTRVGRVRGKPQYMSPEQIRGHPLDARSDLFSAGLLLYEMLAGLPAYGGFDDNAIMNAILAGDLTPPSARNHDLPRSFDPVLKKALHLDADQRYASAAELRQAILDTAYLEKIRPDPDLLAATIKRVIPRSALEAMAAAPPSAVVERSGADGELEQFRNTGTSSRPAGTITHESERGPAAKTGTPVEPTTAESTRGPATTPSTLDPPPKPTRVLPPSAAKVSSEATTIAPPQDEGPTNTNVVAPREASDETDIRSRPPVSPVDEASATKIRVPRGAPPVEPSTEPMALGDDRNTLFPDVKAPPAQVPRIAIASVVGVAVVLLGYWMVAVTMENAPRTSPTPVARTPMPTPTLATVTLEEPVATPSLDGATPGRTPLAASATPLDGSALPGRTPLAANATPLDGSALPGRTPLAASATPLDGSALPGRTPVDGRTPENALDGSATPGRTPLGGAALDGSRTPLGGTPLPLATSAAAVAARTPSPVKTASPGATRTPAPVATPLGMVTKPPASATPIAAKTPKPAARTGTLSLNSKPWGEVTIDGRSAGPTPIVDLALPAGTHAIVITGAGGVSASFTVTIEAGKSIRRSVELK